MSVLCPASRRFFLAAGMAIAMAATPVAATAVIGADTVSVPRSVVAEPCTIDAQNASASLNCAPNDTNNGNGAIGSTGAGPGEMDLTESSDAGGPG